MKKTLLLLLLITLQTSLFSQSENIIGNYEKTIDTRSDSSIYQLSLNEDGTFIFQYSQNIHCAACPQEANKGKGTWKEKKGIIFFKSKNGKDINEEFTVNLNKTKANIEEKLLRVTESNIPYLKDIVLVKQ